MADAKVPFITGFCGVGLCEGKKPKSPSGLAMKTCPRIIPHAAKIYNAKGVAVESRDAICTHECHTLLDRMFEMTGQERILQDNPDYSPAPRNYWMPSLEDRVELFNARSSVPTILVPSADPDRVPATLARSYEPTPSGRAGRGQLELWVKNACDQWLVNKVEESCTPAYLSLAIAQSEGVREPSVGAISAVFDRWSSLGFALVGKKPVRFLGYMPDGVKLGLEALKLRAKLKQSDHNAAKNRGERR